MFDLLPGMDPVMRIALVGGLAVLMVAVALIIVSVARRRAEHAEATSFEVPPPVTREKKPRPVKEPKAKAPAKTKAPRGKAARGVTPVASVSSPSPTLAGAAAVGDDDWLVDAPAAEAPFSAAAATPAPALTPASDAPRSRREARGLTPVSVPEALQPVAPAVPPAAGTLSAGPRLLADEPAAPDSSAPTAPRFAASDDDWS